MSDTLTALTATPAKVQGLHFLKQAGTEISRRMTLVRKGDHDVAFHALCVGALLWAGKSQSKHGDFKPWIERTVPAKSYRTCVDYMKLVEIFAGKSRLKPEEAIAMAKLKPKGAKGGAAKSAAEKLSAFIGDLSLHELMIKHGVRGVGLKHELTGGEDAPPALTSAEQAQMELELIWAQAYEPAKSLAELLTEKARVLSPEQRDALKAELTKALQAIRAA